MREVQRNKRGSVVRLGGFAGAALLTFALLVTMGRGWSPAVVAQDATPEPDGEAVVTRPAHIHEGTCDDLDPNPLVPLNDVSAPVGDAAGPVAATQVEISVTTAPIDLATILSADHAINVHLSNEEVDVYIACGELGGIALDGAGSLSIGLREQNDSGFSGVAFLTPNAADPSQTDISVFLAEGLTGGIPGLDELPGPGLDGTPDVGVNDDESDTDTPDDEENGTTEEGSSVEADGTPEA